MMGTSISIGLRGRRGIHGMDGCEGCRYLNGLDKCILYRTCEFHSFPWAYLQIKLEFLLIHKTN